MRLLFLIAIPLCGAGQTSVPTSDPGFFFSPGNWVQQSGYAVSPNAGSYFYLSFTGTAVSLLVDTSYLGANPLWLRFRVDNFPFQDLNIQGADAVLLGKDLANTAHTVSVYYRGRSTGLDSWNLPMDGFRVRGAILSSGASTLVPSTRGKTMLVLGDSRVEGFRDLSTDDASGQDATSTTAFILSRGLDTEIGLAAYAGQGYTVGGATNVPPLFTPDLDSSSSWNKVFSGHSRTGSFDYVIVLDFGGNDSNAGSSDSSVEASVTGLLMQLRSSYPSAELFLIPSYEGTELRSVSRGFKDYQSTKRDPAAFLINPSLSVSERVALISPGGPTYLTTDGVHPTLFGQTIVAASILFQIKTSLTRQPSR